MCGRKFLFNPVRSPESVFSWNSSYCQRDVTLWWVRARKLSSILILRLEEQLTPQNLRMLPPQNRGRLGSKKHEICFTAGFSSERQNLGRRLREDP